LILQGIEKLSFRSFEKQTLEPIEELKNEMIKSLIARKLFTPWTK